MNKEKLLRITKCIISVIILVIIDQLTKAWAVSKLKDTSGIPIIKGALEFYYLPNGNTGAAFGMLEGHQILFMIIAILISAILLFIIYNMPFDKKYRLLTVLLTMIIAGGIGNMLDRIRLNYVIDFIYFSLINFPIFNVADMYVSVGTVVFILSLLIYYKESDIKEIEDTIKKAIRKQ